MQMKRCFYNVLNCHSSKHHQVSLPPNSPHHHSLGRYTKHQSAPGMFTCLPTYLYAAPVHNHKHAQSAGVKEALLVSIQVVAAVVKDQYVNAKYPSIQYTSGGRRSKAHKKDIKKKNEEEDCANARYAQCHIHITTLSCISLSLGPINLSRSNRART